MNIPMRPIIWSHMFDSGRVFYTGLGHTKASYKDAWFQNTLKGAIIWAVNSVF
jgi:hypothetical protein